MSFFSSVLAGKRLELLKEVAPNVSRVAVLSNPAHPGESIDLREVMLAGQRLGLSLHYEVVRRPQDFDSAFAKIEQGGAEALLVIPDALTLSQRQKTAEFTVRSGIPLVSGWGEYANAGALMTYGPDLRREFARVAYFVDKIRKGAEAGRLPIERPTKFELVINLKTARALGLTIPPSLLLRADHVIE